MWILRYVNDIFSELENEKRMFIYKWDVRYRKEKIFAIDIDNIDKKPTIIIISVPYPQFELKYNHLTLVVSNLDMFQSRLYTLSNVYSIEISEIRIIPDVGHVIVKEFSIRDMVEGKNKGIVVKVYCQEAALLYRLLQKNLDEYYVEAFAEYHNVIQCFSNHLKYEIFKKRGIILSSLRGCLFRLDIDFKNKDFSLLYIEERISIYKRITSSFFFNDVFYLALSYDKQIENIIGYNNNNDNNNNDDVIRKGVIDNNVDEKKLLLNILRMLEKHKGLIIAMNEFDVENLRKKMFFYNLHHYYPHWKLSIKLGKGIKINEIPSILCHTDQCPSLETIFNITKVTVSLLENFFQSIVFAPINAPFSSEGGTNSKIMNNKKNNTTPGGLVLTPISGRYAKVVCLDFQSLYPNIMANFGIIKGRVCRVSKNDLNNEDVKIICNEYFHILGTTGDNFYYLSLKDGNDPIRVLCRYLMDIRSENPNIGAFKLIINSIYGLFANRKFSLYSPIVATTITKYGRFFLTRCIDFFRNNNNLDCLYGDTDSIFVHYSNENDPQRLAMTYNTIYPQIQLKVEAIFEKLFLIRKKLYFGKVTKVGKEQRGEGGGGKKRKRREGKEQEGRFDYKFSGFQKKFLGTFKKFLTGLINAETDEELDSKKRILSNFFFDYDCNEKEHLFYWNTYIEPLLFILKKEREKYFQSLGYKIIRFDDGSDTVIELNHIVFSSNKNIIWKKRRLIKENDNILFSRFQTNEKRTLKRDVKRKFHFFLKLDDGEEEEINSNNNKPFFKTLTQLQSTLLLPLLGNTELSSLILYVSIDQHHGSSFWLYDFLCFVYNKPKTKIMRRKNEKKEVAFVLPYDVLTSE